MRKHTAAFYGFCLGGLGVIAQAVLIREFMTIVYGNELTIALVLGSWFLFVALGAVMARHSRLPGRANWLIARTFPQTMAFFTCAGIVALRGARAFLGLLPAEYVPYYQLILLVGVVLLPVSTLVGFSFPLIAERAAREHVFAAPAKAIYVWETCGAIVCGLVFTFVLVRVDPLLCSLCLLLVLILLGAGDRPARRLHLAYLLLAFLFVALGGPHAINRLRWQGLSSGSTLLQQAYTPYQQVMIGGLENSRYVYLNSRLAYTIPDPQDLARFRLALCLHPNPRRLLYLGQPSPEKLALMHRLAMSIDLVVEDQALFALLSRIRRPRDGFALTVDDPLHFLLHSRQIYDLIILQEQTPDSYSNNRLYTSGFFRLLARRLADDGIMVCRLPARENVLTGARARLLLAILRPLQEVLPRRVMLPGPSLLVAASRQEIATDIPLLMDRYRRNLAAHDGPDFDPRLFYSLVFPERIRSFARELTGYLPDPPDNSFFRPIAMIFCLLTDPGAIDSLFSRVLELAYRLPVAVFYLTAALTALGLVLLAGRGGGRTYLVLMVTGGTGMTMEIVLLYLFQSIFGGLYYKVALFIPLFMAGILCGAWLSSLGRNREIAALRVSESGKWCYLLACLVIVRAWPAAGEWLYMLLMLLAGLWVGVQFPLLVRLYRRRLGIGPITALLEKLDHLGAFCASVVAGMCVFPLLGFVHTMTLLLIVNSASLYAAWRHRA